MSTKIRRGTKETSKKTKTGGSENKKIVKTKEAIKFASFVRRS